MIEKGGWEELILRIPTIVYRLKYLQIRRENIHLDTRQIIIKRQYNLF